MNITLIICGTIFILSLALLIVSYLLVEKYLEIRQNTYNEMDVLHSERLLILEEKVLDIKVIQEKLESFSKDLETLKQLQSETKEIPDFQKLEKDVAELKTKLAVNQIGKVFTPRRK